MRAATGIALAALAMVVGCAGTSTFVSAEPPVATHAEAWFPRSLDRVRQAVAEAMIVAGMSVVPGEGSPRLVVAEKHQLPYIGEEAEAPPAGPLPFYSVRAALSRRGTDTHVRVLVEPDCPSCDGTTLYEWEYPVDLIRSVLERTRSSLGHKGPPIQYPPRFVPRRSRR